MSRIKVKDLFNIENLRDYKLHVARYSPNAKVEPLDVFVNSKEDWLQWNTYRLTKDDFNRKYIFSIINFYHEAETWLFGGIYEVLQRRNENHSNSYDIREVEEYSKYIGRLKIGMKKPSRGRAFLLEKHYENMIVSEILKRSYSGEVFPGYENINCDFKYLEYIIRNEKADWKSALLNVKGVYLISDIRNGKKYIGSAYGDFGIWSRWNQYINSGHGGNAALAELIDKKGIDYARENFRFSLLEYRSMKTDDNEIINREQYWKSVLLSQGEFGYNKN